MSKLTAPGTFGGQTLKIYVSVYEKAFRRVARRIALGEPEQRSVLYQDVILRISLFDAPSRGSGARG